MYVSEVTDNLDSEHFDDLMAEGSDDDLGMDIDYNSDDSEGIIEYIIFINILKLQILRRTDDMDTEEPPSDETSHSSEPVMS